MDFGRVLGGFWEAKIDDFRTFFDVFSKSFLKRVSEDEKMHQDEPTRRPWCKIGTGLRCMGGSWGEIIERGSSKLSEDLVDKSF